MIYFLEAVGLGVVKIGFSTNPERRLKTIDDAMPCETRVLAIRPGGLAEEAELHRRFSALHVRGEWFTDDLELRSWIAELCEDGDSIDLRTKRCVDCGRMKPRSRSKRCRKCHGAYRRRERVAPPKKRCTCGVTLAKSNASGRCRPCSMRLAWARPDYRQAMARRGRA